MPALRFHPRPFRPLQLRCAGWALSGVLAVSAAAEVPLDAAYELHLQTLPARGALSPLWGMAALQTGVLANVRFFGAYGGVAHPAFPAHPSLDGPYDQPQDAVSALVQHLFPSPDGRNLVPNERDNDPIGLIAREQRGRSAPTERDRIPDSRGSALTGPIAEDKRALSAPITGLRKVMALLDAADAYRERLKSPEPATEAGDAFKETVRRILAPAVGIREHGSRKTNYDRLRKGFAGMMQQALLEEIQDKEGRYPPRIVETALLAYAWLVADSPAELKGALPGLFQPLDSRPAHGHEDPPPAETKAVLAHPEAGKPGPQPTSQADPAWTFSAIFQSLQSSSPTPAFLAMGHADWQGHLFPDCGETSLRNFFLAMLWTKGDRLDPQRITDLEARFPGEVKDPALGPAQVRFEKLIRFFRAHPRLAEQGTRACRDAWAAIVSNVNLGAKDPLQVPYRTAGSCNLAGEGLGAMLNLVAHLLPDPFLNAPWPEPGPARASAIAGRLDRLCSLFPRSPLTLDWDAPEGKDRVGSFSTLTFSLGTKPQFTWEFVDRHYHLASCPQVVSRIPLIEDLGMTSDDYWVRAISWPHNTWQHNGRIEIAIHSPNQRFYYSHFDAGAFEMLKALLRKPSRANWDVISLLVQRGLPRTAIYHHQLADFFARNQDPGLRLLPGLRDLPQPDRTRLLAEGLASGSVSMTRLLIAHGTPVNAVDGHGMPMVHWAALKSGAGGASLLAELAAAGADFQVRDPRGRTALHIAVEYGNLAAVRDLLEKGLDPFATDKEGRMPMVLASKAKPAFYQDLSPRVAFYLGFLEFVAMKEKKAGPSGPVAGADPEVRDPRGRTALHTAVEEGNPGTAIALLQKGLDPFAGDRDGRTPMDLARTAAGPYLPDLPPGLGIYLELLEHVVKPETKAGTSAPAAPGPSPEIPPGQ